MAGKRQSLASLLCNFPGSWQDCLSSLASETRKASEWQGQSLASLLWSLRGSWQGCLSSLASETKKASQARPEPRQIALEPPRLRAT